MEPKNWLSSGAVGDDRNVGHERPPLINRDQLRRVAPDLVEEVANVALMGVTAARLISRRDVRMVGMMRATSVRMSLNLARRRRVAVARRKLVQAIPQQRDGAVKRQQTRSQQLLAGASHAVW